MARKIKICENGPYEVTGGVPLKQAIIQTSGEGESETWTEGKEYPQDAATYHLCRCGRSENKPFCDGSHAAYGFEGREVAPHHGDPSRTKVYKGAKVDLVDEESLCASMRFCDVGPTAWNAALHSDRDGYQDIAIDQACNCASGRLTVVTKDGKPIERPLDQEISPVEDTAAGWRGPLWVKGGITLEGGDGQTYQARNRMTLCRCGESHNAPFCDTSHLSCPHMRGFDK